MFDLEKNRELKEAFLKHLPERVANLQKEWKQLCEGEWNPSKMADLFQKIQELSGAGGRFSLMQLSESALSLEAYLSSFIESGSCPKKGHLEKTNELFHALGEAVKTARPQKSIMEHKTKSIYFLHASDQLAPGLPSALESQGCTLLTFSNANDVIGSLLNRLPDLLIVDGEFLPVMGELSRVLAVEQEEHNKRVPVICLSQTRSLKQRLRALRLGVDAYYVSPINNQEIIEKTQELTTPKEEYFRILVVEDDPAQAKFATSILEKGGMKTLSITDPMKVLDALDEFRPDLILMDLYMPNASGTELTAIIREHPDFVATPVVFLSGEQDVDKKLVALSTGGDDFLTKPIRPRHLINTITNRVRRAKSLQGRGTKQSSRDPVSGLYHRRHFFQQLDNVLAKHQNQPVTGAVLYLTIPNLNTQDLYTGEDEKAALIATLGTLISSLLEEQDVAARMDDDNFIILITRPHEKNIQPLVDKLRQAIEQHPLSDDNDAYLIAHIGVTPFTRDTQDAAGIVMKAAKAAAQLGQQESGAAVYNDESSNDLSNGQLQAMIKDAWDKQSIQILYQPLKDRENPHTEHYNIALRVLTAGGPAIPDADIYLAAAEAGLTVPINQWLLEQVLNSLAEKRAEGNQVTFFVHQSIPSLGRQERALSWLIGQLRSRHMVGAGLVFEYRIAELGSDIKNAKLYISKLQELGVQIALSRFGANKAALTVLQYLKADYACLANQLLKANPEAAGHIVKQIHQAGARTVISPADNKSPLPPHWQKLADLEPGKG